MKRTRVAQMDKASWTRVAQHLGGPGLPLVCHASGNPPRQKTWSLSRFDLRFDDFIGMHWNYFNAMLRAKSRFYDFIAINQGLMIFLQFLAWATLDFLNGQGCSEWFIKRTVFHGYNLFLINTDRLYRYFVFTYNVHRAMRDYQLVALFCRCKISRISKPNLWTSAGMIVWNGRLKSGLIKKYNYVDVWYDKKINCIKFRCIENHPRSFVFHHGLKNNLVLADSSPW